MLQKIILPIIRVGQVEPAKSIFPCQQDSFISPNQFQDFVNVRNFTDSVVAERVSASPELTRAHPVTQSNPTN